MTTSTQSELAIGEEMIWIALQVDDLLNDRVLPFFDEHEVKLLRMLTDRGTEYCGNPEHHEYELYLAVEDIDHTRERTRSASSSSPTLARMICSVVMVFSNR